jgi:hypothetical protein
MKKFYFLLSVCAGLFLGQGKAMATPCPGAVDCYVDTCNTVSAGANCMWKGELHSSGESTACRDCDGGVVITPRGNRVCVSKDTTIAWEHWKRWKMCKYGEGQGYFMSGGEVSCDIKVLTNTGNWCGQVPAR